MDLKNWKRIKINPAKIYKVTSDYRSRKCNILVFGGNLTKEKDVLIDATHLDFSHILITWHYTEIIQIIEISDSLIREGKILVID